MTNSIVRIGVVHYPGALLSAVQGLAEQFYLANTLHRQNGHSDVFKVYTCDSQNLPERRSEHCSERRPQGFSDTDPLQVIILPPCLNDAYYLSPEPALTDWIRLQHRAGAIICSVCAGAFVLAETGLLDGRTATSHWQLADDLARRYPNVRVDSNRMLINDGDIITSGGLMSWIDLGLELVAQFTSARLMRQLGRYLLVDTGSREQRYYQSFSARLDHGDDAIVRVQHRLQREFSLPVRVRELAGTVNLTERTFLRRFVNATGLKPTQYIQRLRVQKACELIESSLLPFERVALEVGYEDTSSFRKTFAKITGQTPREFRNRFSREAG